MVRNPIPGIQTVTIAAAQQLVQRLMPTLELKIDDAVAQKPDAIDLVLAQVQIIDSSALNWLLSIHARLDTLGIHLRLVDPSPIMADVLLATRLDSRFTVEVRSAPLDAAAVDPENRVAPAPAAGGPN